MRFVDTGDDQVLCGDIDNVDTKDHFSSLVKYPIRSSLRFAIHEARNLKGRRFFAGMRRYAMRAHRWLLVLESSPVINPPGSPLPKPIACTCGGCNFRIEAGLGAALK